MVENKYELGFLSLNINNINKVLMLINVAFILLML